MICQIVPFPMMLSDPNLDFKVTELTVDALDILCAELTRDLFAIAELLVDVVNVDNVFANYPDDRCISGGYGERTAGLGCCVL